MEQVQWSLQPVCSSSSFVCTLSKCVGDGGHLFPVSAPPYRPASDCHFLPLTVIFFLCSYCRALQDVQIRFQPQLNPDVVAPLPSHSTHEDFRELGVRGKWVLTTV